MGFITITSEHPNFSYLIGKNPASGMISKKLRKGVTFGWYSPTSTKDKSTYCLYFTDLSNEVSFSTSEEDKFDYLNKNQYIHPEMIWKLLDTLIRFSVDTVTEKDSRDTATLTIPFISIDGSLKVIEKLQEYQDQFQIKVSPIIDKGYQIEITHTGYLNHLLNFTYLMLHFIIMANWETKSKYLEESIFLKIAKIIHLLDFPYYLRYFYQSRFIPNRDIFTLVKKELELSSRYMIQMQYGNTAQQRKKWITSNLDLVDTPTIDVGCGEGAYLFDIVPKSKQPYYAIDTDPECLISIQEKNYPPKGKCLNFTHVHLLTSWDEFINIYGKDISVSNKNKNKNKKCQIILTEVIEHMPLDEAKDLIFKVLTQVPFATCLITTPNQDFNQYYHLKDGFRHHDHDWEMTCHQFNELMANIIQKIISSKPELNKWHVEFASVGDQVNDVGVSLGVKITDPDKIRE